MQPAIFLDRDNTLIANDGDLGDPEAVRLLDGVAPGLQRLREAGYRLIVVSNQGGVARGVFTEQDVDAVNRRIADLVDAAVSGRRLIDRFYYCPYHPKGSVDAYRREHPWRKPQAGMLHQAAADMDLDLSQSWMVGDQPRDIQAGRAAGCRTVLLNPGNLDDTGDPTIEVKTFPDAVDALLTAPGGGSGRREASRPTSSGRSAGPPGGDLHRAVVALTDELRTQRLRGAEFTSLRMGAFLCQIAAAALGVLGLLHLTDDTVVFFKWIAGAGLLQLLTITLLLLDGR